MQNAIEEPNLLIRFRRGDQWVAGRLCSAGVTGVFVATNTPARVGEIVDLEISMEDESGWRIAGLTKPELNLRGVTVMSRTTEHRGPPGFAVHLRFKNPTSRRALVVMLQAARGQTSLNAPPKRSEARYPISWPVLVRSGNTRCRMSALDVSESGMFVGGAAPLPSTGARLDVTFAVDTDGPPIRGETCVARIIPRDLATRRKLRRGMGLQFCQLGSRHRREYHAFVKRVAFRSTKHVVISAAGIRLNHLVTELNGVGYAVSSVSDATKLFAVCGDESNTPDLVIFDESFSQLFPSAIITAQRTLTERLIASADFDQPFAKPVRALADSILAPVAPAWIDQGWT